MEEPDSWFLPVMGLRTAMSMGRHIGTGAVRMVGLRGTARTLRTLAWDAWIPFSKMLTARSRATARSAMPATARALC